MLWDTNVHIPLTDIHNNEFKIDLNMIAAELVSPVLRPITPDDTGISALHWFDEFNVEHLPMVNNNQFLGILSEDTVFEQNSFEEPLRIKNENLLMVSVNINENIYDILRIFHEFKLTSLPVTDLSGTYIGTISYHEILEKITELTGSLNPGAVIVIETNVNDLSLVELSQIVESNHAQIMSYFVTTKDNTLQCDVTMKLNRMDIQPVIETLNRYNYTIKATYFDSDLRDNLRERYDNLMNFLNM